MNTKEKLMQLLELCYDKKLTVEYSFKHDQIYVNHFDDNSECLFNANVIGINNKTLKALLTKVKNYQP